METRKILIANNKTQTRHEVMTDATTLGELKAVLDAQGINYEDMTFTEGISKTRLLSDDTPLPQNVMFHGSPTNNLIMLLTNTEKKIKSGADDGSRREAYDTINEIGDGIKEFIKEETGKNYTQVTTDTLWDLIEDFTSQDDEDEEYEDEDEEQEEEASVEDKVGYVNMTLKTVLPTLEKVATALETVHAAVTNSVKELSKIAPRTYQFGDVEVSDAELDNMLAGL